MLSNSNNLLLRSRQLITAAVKKYIATTCMHNDKIHNVTVLGGGVMGSGIAQVNAQNGYNVTVVDTDAYTQKCMVSITKSLNIISTKKFPNEVKSARKYIDDVIGNITTTQDLENGCANADLVIESVTENLDIKKDLLEKVDALAPPKTIFSSNTSSLLIQEISVLTKRGDRFTGLHFFNPVWNMKLVEVIGTSETSEETMNTILEYISSIGKVAVKCNDNPGFIVNSMLYPYLMEALRFFERGHASIQDIDAAMKLGAGLPSGPFELIDIIGVDTVKSVIDHWHEKYPDNPKYFPSETLNLMTTSKKLGRKTGQGFYTYRHKLY